MPGSASSTYRPEGLIERLQSAAAAGDGGEAKLKVLRELKNQIIGNRTKKLSCIELGAVPCVVSILSSASSSADCLLVQSAAVIGSFACGVDAGAKAVLDAGAIPLLIRLISHSNEKVVDAGARALKMIYQSKMAPKYDFFERKNMEFLISLLDKNNENVTALGASIITCSCKTSAEQKALNDAGVFTKLFDLIESTASQIDATLESFATIVKENPVVISQFVGPEDGRTSNTLIVLMKDRSPRTRLLASKCLILIKNAAPSYLQSVGIKTKLILVLLELLDDPGQVGDEAAFALSSFITGEEGLQRLAFEANAVNKLCNLMQEESIEAKRLEGIFFVLADLLSNLECCRSIFLRSPKTLTIVIHGLKHTTMDVRTAACICLKNVSRSVKYLSAGYLMREEIINPLIQLLYDTSTSVLVAALCTISNIVVDFTRQESIFMKSGGVKQLAQLSKSSDSTVRLNAVWGLRNLAFLVNNRGKERIFMELTASALLSLVCDPQTSVQEQALALIRNLVDGPEDFIKHALTEDLLLLHAVGRKLWSASEPEVLIQAMYILCNFASGKECHKEAVVHQILPQPGTNEPRSIMIKMLQSDDIQLRIASVWTIVNLTFPTGTGAFARVVKLRNAGVIWQLKNMVNDPCLDVKLRVGTAIGKSMTFGDFST